MMADWKMPPPLRANAGDVARKRLAILKRRYAIGLGIAHLSLDNRTVNTRAKLPDKY